jgi:hypothetical protein
MPSASPIELLRTSVTRTDFTIALIEAWRRRTATVPTKAQVAVLWAQYALETGEGAYCWNNNLGNVKVTQAQASAGVPYTMLHNVREIENGKPVTYQPPSPQTWFRAYDTLSDGMADYVKRFRDGNYSLAWPAVLGGDPEAFAGAIKSRGYFSAPLVDYQRGMRGLFTKYMRLDDYERAVEAVDSVPTIPAVDDQPIIHADPSVYLQNGDDVDTGKA